MVDEGEEIEGYACDSCKGRTKASVSRSLWRLGNWVIVVLKRNENSGRRINTPVEIPEKTTFSSVFHSASMEPSAKDPYELFATVNHHGSSGGGHYTAQARHPVSGQWAFFDDENAREIERPELGASTYIVMYRRQPA
jgi:ubiquitin carboxyl-terminal hydrolase 4/11/15